MEKNTALAIFLSALFLIVWWTYFQAPAQKPQQPAPAPQAATTAPSQGDLKAEPRAFDRAPLKEAVIPEQEVTVETENYKAVFTNRGAAVKNWFIKEKDGTLTDLVLPKDTSSLSTFPGSNYTISMPEPRKVVFTHVSPQGWRITKTYALSDSFLHNLEMEVVRLRPDAPLPRPELDWGPGLGTDAREQKENESVIRTLGYTVSKPRELIKFKPGEYQAADYSWVAVDNRYFLAAFIPDDPTSFGTVSVYREAKKTPPVIVLSAGKPSDAARESYSLRFYLGPKGLSNLRPLSLNLEETIDFGFFGFLGKAALSVLLFFYKLTNNYGWAIIILTIVIQIIVLPLTLKSFKASAAMKKLQPLMKNLQAKYKSDPKRLNIEMMNLYKTQKVNPLGGCLPMLLQLPIFWALFTTLRNAIELRGAPWILWVQDLSAPDALFYLGSIPFNVLPLLMGAGMFVQQKMMSVSTDPMQQKMMYMMPVIFTFMFWGFPAGLVLYWLTNSIVTMAEQYYVLRRQQTEVAQNG